MSAGGVYGGAVLITSLAALAVQMWSPREVVDVAAGLAVLAVIVAPVIVCVAATTVSLLLALTLGAEDLFQRGLKAAHEYVFVASGPGGVTK